MGVIIATIGAGISLCIILSIVYFWVIRISDFWFDRWVWVKKLIIRKMIFRSKFRGTESVLDLNADIDALNHIFWKYDLIEPLDKEDKEFVKEYKEENAGNR